MSNIECRIKEARRARGLTLKQVAELIGVSESAVSKFEHGSKLSEQSIVLFCQKLQINRTWLETGEGEMYDKAPTDLIDQLAQENHLGVGGRALLKAMTRAFLELDEEMQERLFQTVWNIMQNELLDSGPTDEEFFGTDASSSDGNELSS